MGREKKKKSFTDMTTKGGPQTGEDWAYWPTKGMDGSDGMKGEKRWRRFIRRGKTWRGEILRRNLFTI